MLRNLSPIDAIQILLIAMKITGEIESSWLIVFIPMYLAQIAGQVERHQREKDPFAGLFK